MKKLFVLVTTAFVVMSCGPKPNEIWYTSVNGKVVLPYSGYVNNNATAFETFGANIVSNTYANGKGVIKFDGNVTSIGYAAFLNCSSLTSVTIPDSVTSIGKSAFKDCSRLTSATIGNSVTSIGYEAFDECLFEREGFINNSSLDAVANNYWGAVICDVVQTDGLGIKGTIAVSCRKTATSVTIPDSVTSIGDHAFGRCTSLRSITIPDSVTSIGGCAFWGCSSLTSITIPISVISIGQRAFSDCRNLTSVTIPNSVTSIGEGAFLSCTSLRSITIPDSVTSIREGVFNYCSSLTSITIPDSVTSIGNCAFLYCTSLEEVYCKPTTPPTGDKYMFSYYDGGFKPIGCKIYVPRNSVEAYKSTQYWSDYASYIEGYDF
ncbi:MAG: leucine-rich repeat domain-containing protein [Alistipes sp.]|nr:leucine-rich repeat domain-containing protein [Alistipes sp.]